MKLKMLTKQGYNKRFPSAIPFPPNVCFHKVYKSVFMKCTSLFLIMSTSLFLMRSTSLFHNVYKSVSIMSTSMFLIRSTSMFS